MQSKTLSKEALATIDEYLHFKAGNATASIPYFNNKTVRRHGGMRVLIGKGSPADIEDETKTLILKQHVNAETLTNDSLNRFLVDMGLGIDCSGFSYHVLEAESLQRGAGRLNKHMSFVHSYGPMGKMISHLRPVENCGVSTIAAETNSRTIATKDIMPGDFISMLSGVEDAERNHILVIHAVDFDQNDPARPTKIYYSHAMAYPEDGLYGTGIKQGVITVTDPSLNIVNQKWSEGSDGDFDPEASRIIARALASKTELRRLKWF